MSRIVHIISAVAVALVLNHPAWPGESAEEQQIIKTVKETWKKLASKEVSDGLVSPAGTINAQSSGGLWMNVERETFATYMKESPNTLKFTPYHINVKFLGQKKDVAYVTYYLVGKIVFLFFQLPFQCVSEVRFNRVLLLFQREEIIRSK